MYGTGFLDLHTLLFTLDDPEHRDAIEYDLIALGLRLREVGTDRLTWGDVCVVLRQAPRSSALFRAVYGDDHEWDLTNQLLADVADSARVANWQRGAAKKSDYPKPIPRPGVKPDTTTYGKGAIPLDDMAAWLGWA